MEGRIGDGDAVEDVLRRDIRIMLEAGSVDA